MQESTIEVNHHPINHTYETDCFRAVKDEDGDVVVKRWVEPRQVVVAITTTEDGRVFHRGARIA